MNSSNEPSNTADTARPLGQVVGLVKSWVERCGWVWAEGQLIEIRRRKGLQFLTVRDLESESSATITCTAAVLDAAGPVTENTQIAILLHPTVYAKNTNLSFEAREIRIIGEGKLLAELEQLKRKLHAEGLFDPRRKKPLPFLPNVIGLVTGKDSAAERDVKTNILKRWPAARIKTVYSQVQGAVAAGQVIEAMQNLDEDLEVDVIIVARGGGSLEDLLPFSDEGLVRAAANLQTPLISAIGHEPDTPILDLVADLRASTPTDAAKRVVPDAKEQSAQINQELARLRTSIATKLRREIDQLAQLRSRPVLQNPAAGLVVHQENISNLSQRLRLAIRQEIAHHQRDLASDLSRIRAMSPKATLDRGYSIVTNEQGAQVLSVHDVEPGDQVQIYLSDGQVFAEIDYGAEDE